MKRAFVGGSGAERRLVLIEASAARVSVLQKRADGATKRNVKELPSEAEARAECDRLARDLLARGYVEQQTAAAAAKPKRAVVAQEAEDDGTAYAYDDVEPAAAVLPRLAPAPAVVASSEGEPKQKKSGKKKKKRKARADDALDKRVLFGIAAASLALVALVGYVVYDMFIKPPTIIGTWQGTMMEFEIGKPIIRTSYALLLDEKKRASMTLQEKYTMTGTYAVQGNRLKLALADEEGNPSEREYKVSVGHSTMDLFDPATGKRVVELIRFREPPVIRSGKDNENERAAPKDLEADASGEFDKEADAQLASVEFAPKDGAFRLRHPRGWEPDTGSRPDNTYSWASFTKGSAKIQVTADVQGSLMSGSDTARNANLPEGSELAPVHVAHEQHAKAVAEEFGEYKEGKPVLFKGSGLGEGRMATFTASSGGLLGSKLRGYRVTLLTNDRRVTVLCQCPPGEFQTLKPTFLAVCRSLSR